MYWGLFWDPTYILVLIGVLLSLIASANVNAAFSRYSRVRSYSGMNGRMAAERILELQGIYDVRVERVSGKLTDHYDPKAKVLRLSDSTYDSYSVAAIGVAAHECGHAVQDHRHYLPLAIRGALVPVANFGASISWPLVLVGLIIGSTRGYYIVMAGVLFFTFAVLFQVVTLPVEFNASHRAVGILEKEHLVDRDEAKMTRKVLFAAALTYVAGTLSALLQLLRLLLIADSTRRD